MVMLRVTAKELESVLFDTGYETLMNYRFGSDIDGSLFEDMNQTSIRYYYSDDNPTLAKNQFEILYTIVNHHIFKADTYSIKLKDFGYYVSNGTALVLKPLHKGNWEFQVELADGNEYSHTALIRQTVTTGRYNFIFEDIRITIMSCTSVFSYDSNDEYSAIVINLTFNLPIAAESVREFAIFNKTFSISNWE